MKGGKRLIFQHNDFEMEKTTVWSFPNRGNWATHSGRYRGNWSPYVPRNLILRYSKPNDWILDQFVGSGTTLIEAKLLGRNAIGIDINPSALSLASKNLKFNSESFNPKIIVRQGDARKLDLRRESVDFICTHPPYANIINYSTDISEDLSLFDYMAFVNAMGKVASEAFRILKRGKFCAIMMGDIRKKGNIIPLGFDIMNTFIKSGFILHEIIIKEQHNCRSTQKWEGVNRNFLLIAHEYIFVFIKPLYQI